MKKRLVFLLNTVFLVALLFSVKFTVNVTAAATEYDLWVAGTQVTSDTLSGTGWKFEPDTNTLVLNDFNYGSGGYGYLIKLKNYSDTKTAIYAFIYSKSGMNLNIRLEGKQSMIGDPYLSGFSAVYAGDNYYESYYGIYNPYGNVTISGSTKLKIYTNQLCIDTTNLNIDGCTGGIEMGAYSSCADVERFNVKGGSKVNAYCGYGGGRSCNGTLYIRNTLNIYDSSEVYSEIERSEKSDGTIVCGIYCNESVNVYGGKLTAISWAQGKTPSNSQAVCMGIQTKRLNLSGGGVVEAFVKQGVDQKSYLSSTGIGYYYSGNGTINIKGAGTIRAGVEKKNPSGTQKLLPNTINQADNWYGSTTATSKDGYEAYTEYTSLAHEGAFLKSGSLSYYRDFKKTSSYPEAEDNVPPALSKIIQADSGLRLYVLEGSHTFEPGLSDNTVPGITMESGTLTLQLRLGKTYTMTAPIQLNAGTELIIDGDGTLLGLDIRGSGKVTFRNGTVKGSVMSTAEMIVAGGNINVDYSGRAKDENGTSVSKREYTLTNDKTFDLVSTLKLRSRKYGFTGIFPFDGKNIYLWTTSDGELLYVCAIQSGDKLQLTLNSQTGNPLLLNEGFGIKTKDDPVRLTDSSDTIVLDPFERNTATAPTEEQMKDYRLVWSHVRYGEWTEIENIAANSDALGRFSYYYNKAQNYNQFVRCEIYRATTNELLGVYSTLIHYVNPIVRPSKSTWSEGEEVTFTITEGEPIPEGYVKTSFGGSIKNSDGKFVKQFSSDITITLTEDMENWRIECWMQMDSLNGEYCAGNNSYYPILKIYNKTAKIDTQPNDGTVLDLDDPDSEATLTVGARNATKYQWQVSKVQSDSENVFEDIPGANEASYTLRSADADLSMMNYVYRCVVSNDVNEVISDEVKFDFQCKPYIAETPEIDSIKLYDGDGTEFAVTVNTGLPQVTSGIHIYWEVSEDGETYTSVEEYRLVNRLWDNIQLATTNVTYEGQSASYQQYQLKITNASLSSMNGLMFRCRYKLGLGQEYQVTDPITLTVVDRCTEDGHTGGTATCYCRAICDVCGEMYGELDPDNHTGTAEWDTKYWNIANTHWKEYTCCHKHIEEAVHTFENGVCTVCGCVCDHSLQKKANCHEEGECYICGLKTAEIDPNNHDLSLGTKTLDKKDPTCTENGYTGDVVCWKCSGVVTAGSVIPANGHDITIAATCQYPAWCYACQQRVGDTDPNNHEKEWSRHYLNITETTHEAHWDCCDMVKIESHDLDENGVCKDCHYGCQHSGGTANCVEQAYCEKCGDPYGDLDPDNHVHTMTYPDDDDTHTERCKCGKIISGPTAHTWENGECTICFTQHNNHTKSGWIIDEAPIDGKAGWGHKNCSVCGMLMEVGDFAAVNDESFTVGHNCSFGNDLSMMYAILKSKFDDCTDIRLVVTKENGNEGRTIVPTERVIDGETYYCFTYTGVAAKEMGDTLTAVLEFTRDGVDYSGTVDTYSLKEYAMERLANSDNEKFKTLLVDLLNYGAAAQNYFEYRTDSLVNADLTAEQRALATQNYDPATVANTENGNSQTTYPAAITGKNIVFGNRITLLTATSFTQDSDLTGVFLRIRYTDINGEAVEKRIEGKDFVYRTDVNAYTAYFDGLKASEFRVTLELTLMNESGEAISETVTYSLDTYVQNRLAKSESESFKALLEATMIYADSAKAYFSETN